MSSKLIRKALSFVLALITVLCLVPSFHKAEAATSFPSVTKTSYIEFYAKKSIKVYKNKALTVRGTCNPVQAYSAAIDAGDKCYIYEICPSYLKISYPVGSTRKEGFIKPSEVFESAAPYTSFKAKAVVYNIMKTRGGSNWPNSYTEVGNQIYGIKNDGSYVQFIYYAKSGSRKYKLAWTTTNDFNTIKNGQTQSNQDIVSVARAELNVSSQNVGGKKYKKWYYNLTDYQYDHEYAYDNVSWSDIAWCASFVSWCANKCNLISAKVYPKFDNCNRGVEWFNDSSRKRWVPVGTAKPQPGWLVFFDKHNTAAFKLTNDNKCSGCDHVGLVWKVEGQYLYVIEGNAGNAIQCYQNYYNIGTNGLGNASNSWADIVGYGKPNN